MSLSAAGIGLKRLVGPIQFPTAVQAVYTVPNDGSVAGATLDGVLASNNRSDSVAMLYYLYLVPSGANLNVSTHGITTYQPLAPGDPADLIKFGGIPLAPGDSIYAQGSLSGACFIAFGTTYL